MRKDWAQETKKRIGGDFELLGGMLLTQRAMASEGWRKRMNLSKTQMDKLVAQQDAWARGTLTRLNVLEVVLERHRLLGKLMAWLFKRLLEKVNKPTMRPVPGAVPAEQRDPTKGAKDGVVDEAAAQTVPQA